MLDPRTICVAIPCYDGKLMSETAGALITAARYFGAVSMPTECSHVSLVRNIIASQFMASNFEWLVSIDADISFSVTDFLTLLEPCNTAATYVEPQSTEAGDPRPTRLVVPQLANVEACQTIDFTHKILAAADVLVCAEYSYKDDFLKPVSLGHGFVRIHRSVFETLQNLKHEPGPTVEVQRHILEDIEKLIIPTDANKPARFGMDHVLSLCNKLVGSKEDKAGTGRLWQTSHRGRLLWDYYPSGPIISQFVPTAEWKGEDHGFFTLCMLAGIIPRIETRTRLTHIGRKAYQYMGPDLGGGQ